MVQFFYKNETPGMVVLKCIGSKQFFVEKVVFPDEVFILDAPEGAKVEIWGIESYGPKFEKRIRVLPINNKLAA
tara:strand:- start:810 stop:1031 length:222 start_codon:yes stop_codon:yes gene_type:complete